MRRPASSRSGWAGPDLTALELMVSRNAWAEVRAALDAPVHDGEPLPPSMLLLHAIALKETEPEAKDADRRAISAMADLLGVTRNSAMALVLGKRLTRRRNWSETPAPSGGVSALFLAVALTLGGLVGWFVTLWMF
jgi:hypothetical protein